MRGSQAAVCGLLLCSVNLWALDSNRRLTQYVHRIWTIQQGLPPGTISDIWQTRDGFIWLGTQTGLVRFDGARFTSAETLFPKLPENVWIRTGYQDPSGVLWIGTNDAGLFRLEDRNVEHFSTKEGLPADQVSCIVPGASGTLWLCTAGGLARISGEKIEAVRQADLPNHQIRTACMASDGRLWVGGDAPFLYSAALNPTSSGSVEDWRKEPLRSIPVDATVRTIACGRQGVWAGTTAGLVEINASGQHLYTAKDGLAEDAVLSLREGSDGSLWVGTRGGFSRLRNGEFESFLPQDGLSQSSVSSLFEDAEGSLWAGTKQGLNQFVDGRAIPYTVSEGLPSNSTGPLIEDPSKTIWIGTLDRGLARLDGRRIQELGMAQGLASEEVLALANYKNAVWVGTSQGVNVIQGGRPARRFNLASGLPSNEVHALAEDGAGVLWAGTAAGPARFNGSGFSAIAGAPADPVIAMGTDREGHLLFSTEHGLFRVNGGSVQEVLPGGSTIRGADGLLTDSEGLVWIANANGGGLRVLDERGPQPKLSTILMRDGLFDSEIYGIVADEQGRLWMACSKGIFSVSRAEILRFIAGKIKKVSSTQYSPTDASRVIECKPGVQPAAWRMTDGQIWFSTIRGLIVLDPGHARRKIPPPPVVIEDPVVNGEPELASHIGSLAPGQKNVEFSYAGLSFVAPTRLRFRYQLIGFDKDWVDAGTRREAFYTNLPPGRYTFRVAACNEADNLCNENGASVAFSLAPAYYQRVWFLPLLVLLSGLAGWLGYQSRIRRLRERYDLIVAERSRIARELHDTLIQGFSGITMGMQALAARLRPSEERGKLLDIIDDAARCLRETRRSVAGLRGAKASATSGLAASIAQAARQITETKNVRLKLRLDAEPPHLAPEFEYHLLRIASEAISNAVKHAGARTIEVTLKPAQGSIFLAVADDGAGCAPAENGHLKPGHYGLIGMKERAAQIGAQFAFESAPGKGTTVSVMAPVERAGAPKEFAGTTGTGATGGD